MIRISINPDIRYRRLIHHLSDKKKFIFLLPFFIFLLASCNNKKTLFTQLQSSETGIDFVNENIDSDTLNILDYLYYYNGAGVSIGDINNDGLPDIYFASNTGGNKLFLNKGNFKFEDITSKAGVKGNADWTTGVTMVDINGDGLLDIYVCAVANHTPHGNGAHTYFKNSRNQLFINNGDLTFTEAANKWGLDLQGYNTQAVFFDYDKDGDLDMFLLQHSIHQTDSYGDTSVRSKYSTVSGGKLFRNDGDHFTDVTNGSGIISSVLGYGLGVAVADMNHDGWDDIYVSNDFHENDYYYVNQGNGTFKEMNADAFRHQSKFSMGNDVADINNDGWPDLVTLDMLPEDEKVLKSSQGDQSFDIYNYQVKFGYNYQYARNTLQLNVGKGQKFSDIALYSGVAATDWSWSPLIADYNLDGNNDIFISNGIKNRLNDLDYIKFISYGQTRAQSVNSRNYDKEILKHQPPGAWHNYIFEGSQDLKFKDQSKAWGFEKPTLSQGAAYADLNNDGAPDLVTNNMNEPAGIYKNNTLEINPSANYISLQLKGPAPNTFSVGAKVFLFINQSVKYQQLQPTRGFMSSVEPLLHFGLGEKNTIDSLIIIWPNNRYQQLKNIKANQKLLINYERKNTDTVSNHFQLINALLHTPDEPVFTNITAQSGIDFKHRENLSFNDFNRQPFIPHQLSTQGPRVAVADVNGDGLEDFYVCGAKGQAGAIFLQQPNSSFKRSEDNLTFETDKNSEDVDAVFFDANGDGHPDLYVVSGGNEYMGNAPELKDRLYLNNGKGYFTKSSGLPAMYENKSVVRVADFDQDGDLDIFVGGRANAQAYGAIPTSYLLQNDGKGNFTIVTNKLVPGLEHIGMVTDAAWMDIDNDGWKDLIIVGEWMAPVLFKNNKGKLIQQKLTDNDDHLKGWWTSLKTADINGDGIDDLLLGNYGLNSKLTASREYPIKMYSADLNGNGQLNQILAVPKQGKYYPFLGKEDLEKQLPYLKKEFLSYSKMAGKTIDEIFGDKLKNAPVLEATTFASVALINNGKGHFKPAQLPPAMQWAPVYAFAVEDFNKDGDSDFLAGGNFYGTLPYEGRYDAMLPMLCIGNGKGVFKAVFPVAEEMRNIKGEVRSIQKIRLTNNKSGLLVALNNEGLVLLQY